MIQIPALHREITEIIPCTITVCNTVSNTHCNYEWNGKRIDNINIDMCFFFWKFSRFY